MNRHVLTWLAVFAVTVGMFGCDPTATGGGGGGKPADAGGAGRGYILRLDALDKRGKAVARSVNCTVVGYAGDKVVTVDGKPYTNRYTKLVTPYKLTIKDLAKVDRIEFFCDMVGRAGDEFLCTVTTLSGAPARFVNDKIFDRDIIVAGDPPFVALCSGSIDARS